jgi:hypothetical protein
MRRRGREREIGGGGLRREQRRREVDREELSWSESRENDLESQGCKLTERVNRELLSSRCLFHEARNNIRNCYPFRQKFLITAI